METKQNYYVLPNKDNGFLTDISVNNHYKDDGWVSVFVPLNKLYGFGKWFFTVRYDYDKKALIFPNNWPANQADQIKNLTDKLNQSLDNNDNLQKVINDRNNANESLKKQLVDSNEKISDLTKSFTNFQKMIMTKQNNNKNQVKPQADK